MSARCKFRLTGIALQGSNDPKKEAQLTFTAMYDPTIPEDQAYTKYTPSGKFEMYCTNPVVLAEFELGKDYYFDITLAPAPVAV